MTVTIAYASALTLVMCIGYLLVPMPGHGCACWRALHQCRSQQRHGQ